MVLWRPALWAFTDALFNRPLRIHVALPELRAPVCDADWGYAYHLERWFRKFLLEHAPGISPLLAGLMWPILI